MNQIELPPHGHVNYIRHLGSDQAVVDAARVSYGAKSKGDEQDKKLLFYLYKNRHTSPFEQCNVTFNIKMPIFVMRQFVRHRMFRLNEISGRYAQLPDEFFLPEKWRVQDTVNRQGSRDINADCHWHTAQSSSVMAAYDVCYKAYLKLLENGVAKEMARFVLPVGIYTEIVVNCDLHNLIHFFRLRLDSHAQSEIRDFAGAMYSIVEPLFPWTFEAYKKFKFQMAKEPE